MNKKLKYSLIIVSALVVLIGFFGAVFGESLLFPEYEMTDSISFAQSIGRGFNLGNTFDACEKYSDKKAGLESEAMWGNPETTRELIAYIKECGFDTVRIPVTWSQHMGDAPDYTVDPEWLDRVEQIVDWVLECDMKAVINTHHEDAFWLVTDEEHREISEEILCKLWSQLCERFKDYDENLIFETMNEPRVTGVDDEWQGNEESREVVNELNFAVLDVIRNSGGNNAGRYVMIPTYAASGLDENIDALRLPDDGRVIVSVHYYYATAHQSEFKDAQSEWNLSQKKSLYKTFRRMHSRFIQKGYGVCKSEFGWTDRDNTENLVANTKFYLELAESFGFSAIVWDNGITDGDEIYSFGIIDRNKLEAVYPEYLSAIVNEK